MRFRQVVCSSLLVMTACGHNAPVRVGHAFADAMPMGGLVQIAIDSGDARIPLVIEQWRTLHVVGRERETAQAERFAAIPGLVAVVGHGGSRDALRGAAVYNREHVPHVVPTATTRRLALSGPWTFAMAPNDSIEG